MRDIKFRGKRADNGEWIIGSLRRFPLKETEQYAIFLFDRNCGYDVKIETIGQYTDLKDKNGREIWEGDIIRVDVSRDDTRIKKHRFGISKVVWSSGGYSIANLNVNIIETYKIEVIGNVHDNPELLNNNNS